MTKRAETCLEGSGLLLKGQEDFLQPVESIPEEAACGAAVCQLSRSTVKLGALLSDQVRPAKGQGQQSDKPLNALRARQTGPFELEAAGLQRSKQRFDLPAPAVEPQGILAKPLSRALCSRIDAKGGQNEEPTRRRGLRAGQAAHDHLDFHGRTVRPVDKPLAVEPARLSDLERARKHANR